MPNKRKTPAWKRVAKQVEKHGQKAELARKTGIPLYALSKVLNGRRPASWAIADKLESVTGIPAREFAVTK